MASSDPDDIAKNDRLLAKWRDQVQDMYDDVMHWYSQKPCDRTRNDLKLCLEESDCHLVHKKSLKECLRTYDGSVPNECLILRETLFQCKRSLIDMRQRFRGRRDF